MQSLRQTYEELKLKYGAFKANLLVVIVGIVAITLFVNLLDRFNPVHNSIGVGYGGGMPTMGIAVKGNYMYATDRAMFDSYANPEVAPMAKLKMAEVYRDIPDVINISNNIVAVNRQVIKNGSINMRVEKAETAVDGITAVAKQYEGFVDSSNIYEISDGIKAGNITIRVPNDSFADAMTDIKKLATKVEREDVNSSDVTAQAVDLEARIKNLKVEEEQYRALMSRSGKIEDILSVANRLSEVRGQIEQIQAQLNYLSRQVAMSNISVSLTAEPEVKIFGIVWRPFTTIKQALRGAVNDLARFVDSAIYFVAGLPGLLARILAVVILIYIVLKIAKWLKRLLTNQLNK